MTKMLINPYIAEEQIRKSYVQYNEGELVGWFTHTVETSRYKNFIEGKLEGTGVRGRRKNVY
jgi:hypothetical protein